MPVFEDWNLKVKKTFNATSNEVVLTLTEAGKLLGFSKDQMKTYVDNSSLTKVPIMRSVHRYLLLKSEIDELLKFKTNYPAAPNSLPKSRAPL